MALLSSLTTMSAVFASEISASAQVVVFESPLSEHLESTNGQTEPKSKTLSNSSCATCNWKLAFRMEKEEEKKEEEDLESRKRQFSGTEARESRQKIDTLTRDLRLHFEGRNRPIFQLTLLAVAAGHKLKAYKPKQLVE